MPWPEVILNMTWKMVQTIYKAILMGYPKFRAGASICIPRETWEATFQVVSSAYNGDPWPFQRTASVDRVRGRSSAPSSPGFAYVSRLNFGAHGLVKSGWRVGEYSTPDPNCESPHWWDFRKRTPFQRSHTSKCQHTQIASIWLIRIAWYNH